MGRGKLWSQTPLERNSLNKYKINLISNNSGYTATMLEFIFNPDSEFPLNINYRSICNP